MQPKLLSFFGEKNLIMKKKTVSDKPAKLMCAKYLLTLGYINIYLAKKDAGCDLMAELNGEIFWIEIKSSSLKKGKFFGTVMLTEMKKSLITEKNFLFLVCRGDENMDFENWLFKLFTPQQFWQHCTLTTPIFHYHLYLDENGNITKEIKYQPETIKASPELIDDMWTAFQKWKGKN